TQNNFFSANTAFDPRFPRQVAHHEDDQYYYEADGRRMAYKGLRYFLSGGDPAMATVDAVVADDQWRLLGPKVVAYAASFILYYIETGGPPTATTAPTITIRKGGLATGRVVSSPNGINSGDTCSDTSYWTLPAPAGPTAIPDPRPRFSC